MLKLIITLIFIALCAFSIILICAVILGARSDDIKLSAEEDILRGKLK